MTVLAAKKALMVAKKWVELEDIELSTGDWFNKSEFERQYKVHRHTARKYAKVYRQGGGKAVDKLWAEEFKGQDKFNQIIKGMKR